jgi:glycosyltransferase involved in cell wall biosynthesis
MKFLIAILTSSRAELSRLAVDSVLAQQQHPWLFDIVVVVNSTNAQHRDAVAHALEGAPVEIIETPSNGRPGRGHNSVLDLFRERVAYDYLVLLDGDDTLYPSAFHQLNKFLPSDPHCIAIQTNDGLVRGEGASGISLRDDWKLNSWLDACENWWTRYSMRNPFIDALDTCATPARPLLMNRAILSHLPARPYNEEMALFDDLLMFLHLCEAHYRRPSFRLFFTSNTYMYLHNGANTESVSSAKVDYAKERQYFDDAVTRLSFEGVRGWSMPTLPHLQVSNPDWFTSEHKVAFALAVIERYALSDVSEQK